MKDKLLNLSQPSFWVVEKTHRNGPRLDLFLKASSGLVVEYVLAYVCPQARKRLCKRFRGPRGKRPQHSKQWSANGTAIPYFP